MQYQHAIRLGMLHQNLGIPAKARIHLQISNAGAFIWDLDAENTYVVAHGVNPTKGRRQIPQHVKEIISATDDDLKNRWLSTMGWDDVRETVFSELAFRGIDILKLEGMG
jgi:hypothetical protein